MMSLFSSSAPQAAWRHHVCGLYYNVSYNGYLKKTYLPQVELQAHATILATTSRTVLTQTFVNPSTEKGIKEVRYTFPLYDGVSVVGFTCHVGDRTIIGEVKEKEKARAVFQEAVARGETAGLLEQLPDAADVFTTTVGNIPPGARVIIKITYLGELKHDMEVDGIRFTIPNIICPRYGNYPGTLRTTSAVDAMGGGISITVDAEMADGAFIQKIQSPTHPISMTMGTTSFAPNAEPTMTKASATLTLGTAQLDTDFVLQVIAKDTSIPKAVLENHPRIPNHRALMVTLVPKFALPAEKPEIVFVCDRSGSMGGNRINLVVQALKVFLKSLPVGVKFNICSFGSSHTFLWPKSVTYSQQTLDEAIRHAATFDANYGGTEMLYPLQATIDQRYKDMSLEVIMLTDGEIWNQQALFSYLNTSITETKAPIRLFTLGIGNGVSHSLIEGVAKAGNGFSQTVGDDEKMDSKVVRMLKGALSPHINDYTLEVKYSNKPTSEEDDDFEIIEKVTDSLKVKLDLGEKKEKSETVRFQSKTMRAFFTDYNQKKPISLFDTSVNLDKEEPPAYDETGEERYAHLPKIPVPKILQAPQNIPSLFAFNRTTAYLLLGPDAPQATPKSVVLRGTSAHGPLELEIPIQNLDLPGETIHQLAAKKAISELEQGRGWLSEAKDESGTLIKSKFEGRFDDMVEREAVRLGVQFQVGGKWCSFVAVESNKKRAEEKEKESQGWEWLEDEDQMNANSAAQSAPTSSFGFKFNSASKSPQSSGLFGQSKFGSQPPPPPPAPAPFGAASTFGTRTRSTGGGLFGGFGGPKIKDFFGSSSNSPSPPPSALQQQQAQQQAQQQQCQQQAQQQAPASSLFGSSSSPSMNYMQSSSAFGYPRAASAMPGSQGTNALQDYQSGLMVLEQSNKKRLGMRKQNMPGQQQQQLQQYSSPISRAAAPMAAACAAPAPAPALPAAPTPSPNPPFGTLTDEDLGLDLSMSGTDDAAALENFDFDSFLETDEEYDAGRGFGFNPQSLDSQNSVGGFGAATSVASNPALFGSATPTPPAPTQTPAPKTLEQLLHHLIGLQTFQGSWDLNAALVSSLQSASIKLDEALVSREVSSGVNRTHLATAIVIVVFEVKLAQFRGSWELVVEKAREWLEGKVGWEDVEKVVQRGRKVVL